MKRQIRSTPRKAASSPPTSSTLTPRAASRPRIVSSSSGAADLPAEREVFLRALADDEAAGVGVGPEGERVGLAAGERHADSLGAEALPLGKTRRVDERVAELDRAVDGEVVVGRCCRWRSWRNPLSKGSGQTIADERQVGDRRRVEFGGALPLHPMAGAAEQVEVAVRHPPLQRCGRRSPG